MNIDPKLWGSNSWKFMHYITLGYPDKPSDEVRKNTYNFFMSLKYLLPCEKCRQNYSSHLVKYPLSDDILKSRDKLVDWLIEVHNEVNVSLGQERQTKQQMLEAFMSDSKIDGRLITIIVIMVLLFVMILIWRFSR